jgi:type II secretory pathway component PulK
MKGPMNGAALIITMWLLALATILALNYSYASRNDTKITTRSVAQHQARAAAEAGLWRAIYEIESPLPEDPWPTDGTVSEFEFGAAEIRIIAQDLTGLADLNSAPPETLETVIGYALEEPQRAEQIVARILDWRDRDTSVLPLGAEDADYQAAGLNYEAKDAPFNTREELQLLLGVTIDEYNAIAPFVTVYAQKKSINLDVAPAYVTRAMPEFDTSSASPATSELGKRISDLTKTRKSTRRGSTSFEILSEATVKGVVSRLAASVESRSEHPIAQAIASSVETHLDLDHFEMHVHMFG